MSLRIDPIVNRYPCVPCTLTFIQERIASFLGISTTDVRAARIPGPVPSYLIKGKEYTTIEYAKRLTEPSSITMAWACVRDEDLSADVPDEAVVVVRW